MYFINNNQLQLNKTVFTKVPVLDAVSIRH